VEQTWYGSAGGVGGVIIGRWHYEIVCITKNVSLYFILSDYLKYFVLE
jgi:hypothetical protein